MRWQGRKQSDNIEDRRGGGSVAGKAKIGGGLAIVIVIIGLVTGTDVSQLLGLAGGGKSQTSAPVARSPQEDEQARFVGVILADTEQTWTKLFKAQGKTYVKPKLVLFTEAVASACGHQTKATGPFYCPGDQKAYLDLSFFGDLHKRFGAPGDFARAYVVAHEIGHHIQNLTGTSTKVHRQRKTLSKVEGNKLSVLQELQADCYAGVWAHHANAERQLLESGDVEEGLKAAAAIGDDTLQKNAGARVQPESWTHGSSEQRVRWFKVGFKGGRVADCDTFAGR
jgi:hypothetical protein